MGDYQWSKRYNSISRHIVYVGGVAADGKTPKDTRTPGQLKALEDYVKDSTAVPTGENHRS